MNREHRGQVVLLAALALAVALVPLVLAYLQLGYHADTEPPTGTTAETDTERVLDRAVHNASTEIATTYEWNRRNEAIQTVHDRLDPVIQTLERARLSSGIASQISVNQSRANTWAQAHCTSGPDRQFGTCDASQGVVVQERSGRTHVLAVAFDVTVTTPDGERQLTTVRSIT